MPETKCACCEEDATHIILICATHKAKIEEKCGLTSAKVYPVSTHEVEVID